MPPHQSTWLRTATTAVLAVYWIAEFVGTHVPRLPEIVEKSTSDKILHFAAYAGLAFLLVLCWSTRRTLAVGHYFVVAVILAAYGAFDEWSQTAVNRTADLGDWLADMAGMAIGLAVAALLCALLPRRWRLPEEPPAV